MGISSVFSLISILGFLLLIAGIAQAVLSASRQQASRGGVLLAVVGLVIGIIFSVISQSVVILQPNQRAVVFNTISGALEASRGPGTNIIFPVLQQHFDYRVDQQQFTMSFNDDTGNNNTSGSGGNDTGVTARTIDGQEVQIDATVIYNIDPTQVNLVHQRWQERYENDFIRPTARSFVRDVVSQYRAEEIYGEQRGAMEQGIQTTLAARMLEEGLVLNDLLVRNISFSSQFTEAIERAQIQEQETARARLEVQRVQQEAEQARARAQGERDAAIARAEGEAQSAILRAEAEAEALRLVSEQIAANPSLIQYEYIRNLGDNVQLALVPSNSPFLFDFNSLAGLPEGNADFTAPDVPQTNPSFSATPEATPEAGS